MTLTWKEFWNRKNRIYVSDRHLEVYYQELVKGLCSVLPEKRPLTLLDYGCGEARGARLLSKEGITLYLYDAAEYMRVRARENVSDIPSARVLDDEGLRTLSEGSIDVVVIYSVLQYLPKEEFRVLLKHLHRCMAPGGKFILGDVVPPSVSMVADVADLLSAGVRHGFFIPALTSLFLTLFSDYRGIRKSNGFTTYEEGEMLSLLNTAGFVPKREPQNIGLGKVRMLFTARRM